MPFSGYVALWSPLEFDSKLWIEAGEQDRSALNRYLPWPTLRERMLDDLVSAEITVGMTENAVVELLGPSRPTRKPLQMLFRLGNRISALDAGRIFASLFVDFRDGRVTGWRVVAFQGGEFLTTRYPPGVRERLTLDCGVR